VLGRPGRPCARRYLVGAQGLAVEAVDAFLQPLFEDVQRVVAKFKSFATAESVAE
jgi:hypothetical protein